MRADTHTRTEERKGKRGAPTSAYKKPWNGFDSSENGITTLDFLTHELVC